MRVDYSHLEGLSNDDHVGDRQPTTAAEELEDDGASVAMYPAFGDDEGLAELTPEQVETGLKLIMELAHVRQTAAETARRIQSSLAKTAAGETDPEDGRQIALEFFEGLAVDAGRIMLAMGRLGPDFQDAADDLETISQDLARGLESLDALSL